MRYKNAHWSSNSTEAIMQFTVKALIMYTVYILHLKIGYTV